MNTVYFANTGALDLDFIRLLGVSVKNTKSPIGYFGTGLKYAIAVLLREQQNIELIVNGETYRFTTRTKTLRGQEIQVIYMNDEQLPFSLDFGKNWKLWQVFRELYSNTIDEGGVMSHNELYAYDTIIKVTGDKFYQTYLDRASIVLESTPLFSGSEIDIHPKTQKDDYLFYRGIRTNPVGAPTRFNFNMKKEIQLTEDRTIGSMFRVQTAMAKMVVQELTDENLLYNILLSEQGHFEYRMDLDWLPSSERPSDAFMRVVQSHRFSHRINPSAVVVWKKFNEDPKKEYESFTLRPDEEQMLDQADALLELLDAKIEYENVRFVKTLGPNVLGRYERGKILISRDAFDQGVLILAGTLYEEYLHAEHGLLDESRSMQNYLLNRLIVTLQRLPLSEKINDEIPF